MLGLALLLALSAAPARADDGARQEVDRLYFHRDQGKNLADSISELDGLIKNGGGPPAEFYWRRCRSIFRRGEKREKKADKLADFVLAGQDCAKSVELNPYDADAHFFYGVVMGKRGETQGILKSLFLIKPIKTEMNAALRLDPNYGGAYRVLGEILWQVPGFAGGDKKEALEKFQAAVRLTPNYTANYQPLAEAYVYLGRKDDAIKTLKAVAEIKDPADPAEYPDDLADARKRLAALEAK